MSVVKFCFLLLLFSSAQLSFAFNQGLNPFPEEADFLNIPHDFVLTNVISDTEIEITPADQKNYALANDLLVIISHETGLTLGYATVKKIGEKTWIATVKMHSKEGLVRIGNFLQKVDLTNYHTKMPGRFDLVRKDQKDIASKFKHLVYLDYQLGQAAATLDKHEHMLGLTTYAYGITNSLQVDTTTLFNFVKIPNAGVKLNVLAGEDFRVSLYTKYYRYLKYDNQNAFDFEAIVDKTANTNMMTFTKVSHKVRRPEGSGILTPNIYSKQSNTEIQTIYGYILNNWNRILLGPKYNFEQKTLGGAAIYTVIYNHFHWSFALQTSNLSKLQLGNNGYDYYLDFYWRF